MSLKNKFCARPFEFLEIGSLRDGRLPCFACCPQLISEEVGDFNTQDVEEIWNSPVYQEIRKSIHDGSFSFCKKEDCPEIQSETLPDKRAVDDEKLWDIIKNKKVILETGPKIINLDYDQTCNLACPSCRTDFINHNNNSEMQGMIEAVGEKLKSQALADATDIIFCSSGDPFASKHYRELMGELEFSNAQNLKVQIVSNGVLFTERTWENFKNLHGHVGLVCISLDAGREPTYQITRKGGNWKILLKNLEFLGRLRAENKLERLRLDFVVQDYNYREMPDLVDIGLRVGADEVFFQKIVDWQTYSPDELNKRIIYAEDHPQYSDFLEVLKDPRLLDPIVNPGNFGAYFEQKYEPRPFHLGNAIKHTLLKRWRAAAIFFSSSAK